MTQFAKQEIRQNILAAAKEEFLKEGYEKASIRTITARAKTAKSNLYNYFPDKDALFAAVLETTVNEIREGLKLARSQNAGKGTGTYTVGSQEAYMRVVMQFVAGHTSDIRLLLYCAGGSSLANFREEVIDEFTGILSDWFQAAMPGYAPSRLFIRCVAGFYMSVIEQMLQEKPTMEQATQYMGEFLKFIYGGWSCLMQGG